MVYNHFVLNTSELIENSIQVITSFFGISDDHKPEIQFLNSRTEMDEFCNRETKPWVVASARNGKIGFLSPDVYEQESSHKFTEEKYKKLITHEICHFYQEQLTGTYKPVWLGEGLAIYLSEQYKDMNAPQEFEHFLNFHSRGGSEVYGESGFVIKLLIDNFGKEKLIKYIKSFKNDNSEEYAQKMFKKIFDIELSYATLNPLIK